MRNNKKLGIWGGNEKLLQAVIDNSTPQVETNPTDEQVREAKWQEEQSQTVLLDDWKDVRITKADRTRGTFKGMYVEREYIGKQNQRRKGHIRNNVERRTINRIKG
jgi:hypothetical protein